MKPNWKQKIIMGMIAIYMIISLIAVVIVISGLDGKMPCIPGMTYMNNVEPDIKC